MSGVPVEVSQSDVPSQDIGGNGREGGQEVTSRGVVK